MHREIEQRVASFVCQRWLSQSASLEQNDAIIVVGFAVNCKRPLHCQPELCFCWLRTVVRDKEHKERRSPQFTTFASNCSCGWMRKFSKKFVLFTIHRYYRAHNIMIQVGFTVVPAFQMYFSGHFAFGAGLCLHLLTVANAAAARADNWQIGVVPSVSYGRVGCVAILYFLLLSSHSRWATFPLMWWTRIEASLS